METSELKLFLARKKRERELKLENLRVTNIPPPKEESPSNCSVSATLSPPENSLTQIAPRTIGKLSAGLVNRLKSKLGPDEQRAQSGAPDLSGDF